MTWEKVLNSYNRQCTTLYKQSFCCKINCTKVKKIETKLHKCPDKTGRTRSRSLLQMRDSDCDCTPLPDQNNRWEWVVYLSKHHGGEPLIEITFCVETNTVTKEWTTHTHTHTHTYSRTILIGSNVGPSSVGLVHTWDPIQLRYTRVLHTQYTRRCSAIAERPRCRVRYSFRQK